LSLLCNNKGAHPFATSRWTASLPPSLKTHQTPNLLSQPTSPFSYNKQEFQLCVSDPIDGVVVTLPQEHDMTNWSVELAGPRDTVYENGIFQLVVTFPPEYPFKPFQINFTTRIYHPNVTNDSLGNICLAALKPDEYKPNKHVKAVLEDVKGLLERPNPDDPLEPRIADEYVKDRKEFEKSARNYVARYAAAPRTAAAGPSGTK